MVSISSQYLMKCRDKCILGFPKFSSKVAENAWFSNCFVVLAWYAYRNPYIAIELGNLTMKLVCRSNVRGNRRDIEQDFGYGLCGLQAHPKSDSQNWYKSRALVLIRTPPLQVFLVSFLNRASKLVLLLICSLSLISFFHRNKEQEFRHIFLCMLSN